MIKESLCLRPAREEVLRPCGADAPGARGHRGLLRAGRHRPHAQGGGWQTLLATSSDLKKTRVQNAFDDVGAISARPRHKVVLEVKAAPGRHCPPRHPTHLNPRFFSYMTFCDVASNICQALGQGRDATGEPGAETDGGGRGLQTMAGADFTSTTARGTALIPTDRLACFQTDCM